VLRDLARRAAELSAEADRRQKHILAIVKAWHPELPERHGAGPIAAATVLCAWSHPGPIRSEAAFAMLGGAAPIPANSGQVTTHYRLNRYGDRQLNRALHTIVLSRIRWDAATRAYVSRRTARGGHSRTNVPRPGTPKTKPSSFSTWSARPIVVPGREYPHNHDLADDRLAWADVERQRRVQPKQTLSKSRRIG
jgi:hypothetical protein